MQQLKTCPLCDGKLELGKINRELNYRGNLVTVEMAGEYCPACDEGFQNDVDIQLNEATIARAKEEILSVYQKEHK